MQFGRGHRQLISSLGLSWVKKRAGGNDWGSVAVDPERGLLIVNYNDTANYNQLIPREEADRLGMKPIYEGGSPASVGEAGAQAGAPYAISVNAGWRVPGTGVEINEVLINGFFVFLFVVSAMLFRQASGARA